MRPAHQAALSVAAAVADSRDIMRNVHYRSKGALRAAARAAGAGIAFVEGDELVWRGGGRLRGLCGLMGRAGPVLLRPLALFAQRYMVLDKPVQDL